MSEARITDLIGTAVRSSDRSRRNGRAEAPVQLATRADGEMGEIRGWRKVRQGFISTAFNCRKVPAGLYRFVPTDMGIALDPQPIASDTTLMLPGSPVLEVLDEIRRFRTCKDEFEKRGLLRKRGVLLWGPPGSGKTCAIHLLVQMVVEDGGIACLVEHPEIAIDGLRSMRKTEPDREIVAVLEDIDALIERHGETHFLAMLDGEVQVGNIIFVATTNYPERIDARFLDRPSRFDLLRFVDMPDKKAREHYLRQREPDLGDDEVGAMVEATEGMSIAHLKEMVVLTRCLRVPMEKAVERLKQYHKRKPRSDDFKEGFGFSP